MEKNRSRDGEPLHRRDSRPIWTSGKELSGMMDDKIAAWISNERPALTPVLASTEAQASQRREGGKKYISRRRKGAGSESGGEES